MRVSALERRCSFMISYPFRRCYYKERSLINFRIELLLRALGSPSSCTDVSFEVGIKRATIVQFRRNLPT